MLVACSKQIQPKCNRAVIRNTKMNRCSPKRPNLKPKWNTFILHSTNTSTHTHLSIHSFTRTYIARYWMPASCLRSARHKQPFFWGQYCSIRGTQMYEVGISNLRKALHNWESKIHKHLWWNNSNTHIYCKSLLHKSRFSEHQGFSWNLNIINLISK